MRNNELMMLFRFRVGIDVSVSLGNVAISVFSHSISTLTH
jgi:hypothetical protein